MNINLWGVPVVKENCNYTFSDFDKETQEYINDYSRIETDSVNVIVNKGSFLEDTKLKKIKDIIQTHALYYRDNIMACTNELEIQSSWLTINHKNSDHPPHMHNHTIFSICYYPRVESGELVLVAPNNGKNSFQNDYKFGFQYTHYNEWNSSNWSIPVISGDVVVFPGYLTHFSTPNKHDKPRLMIGANYWLRGSMQFFDELDRINA